MQLFNRPLAAAFHRRLAIALLALAPGILHTSRLLAQDDLLDKPIWLKVTDKRLDKVLEQLSREEKIYFSYNSGSIQKDRLVTVTIRESTLRQALALLLGEDYTFGEMDNYVIVRKKAAGVAKKDRFADKPFNGSVLPKAYKINMHPPGKLDIHTANSPELEASKQVVRNIIEDLVKEKIINDKDHLEWFGLDNGQFVVNSKAVPDSLHAIFKARYLKPDGYGYYYGPVKIHGRGVFLGKDDL